MNLNVELLQGSLKILRFKIFDEIDEIGEIDEIDQNQ